MSDHRVAHIFLIARAFTPKPQHIALSPARVGAQRTTSLQKQPTAPRKIEKNSTYVMTLQPLVIQALALALTLGVVCVANGQAIQGGAGAPPPWATEPAPADHTKDIPTNEALLRQHLAGGDSGSSGSSGRPNSEAQRVRPGTGAATGSGQPQGQRQSERDEGTNSVANAVKEFVRPLHQEVNNSQVVKALREMDATVSGKVQSERAGDAVSYGVSSSLRGNDAPANAPGSAQAGRRSDPNAAAVMWDQLVDEVMPWAMGGVALVAVGYGAYFWLKLIKIKRLKRGGRRRAERSSRRVERQAESHAGSQTSRSTSRRTATRIAGRSSSRSSPRNNGQRPSQGSGGSIG